jgi:putative transposase
VAGSRSDKKPHLQHSNWEIFEMPDAPVPRSDSSRPRRRIYHDEKHIHFITFSCYKRRTLLHPDRAKRIVIGHLGSRLARQNGICLGFVVMPDHVHALVWFPEVGQLSLFMNKWKDQTSAEIKKLFRTSFPEYWSKIADDDPVWQAKYYGFNIYSRAKVEEKLHYMHQNPVEDGLVQRAEDWQWSSARWYLHRKPVGLPIRWPPGLD